MQSRDDDRRNWYRGDFRVHRCRYNRNARSGFGTVKYISTPFLQTLTRIHRLTLVILALVAGRPTNSQAQSTEGIPTYTIHSFTAENDVPVTDEQYTSGFRYAWLTLKPGALSFSERAPLWIQLLNNLPISFDALFPPCSHREQADKSCWVWETGGAVGQDTYTPGDIHQSKLIPDDRPYAGWLYASSSIQWSRVHPKARQHTAEFTVGILGEASLAGRFQRTLHRLIQAKKPGGWRFQVQRTPGFVISYQYRAQLTTPVHLVPGKLMTDFWLFGGGATGNIFNHARSGGEVRLGANLSPGFARPSISPESDLSIRSKAAGSMAPGDTEYFLFARAEGRYVFSNYLIDGCHDCTISSKAQVVDTSIFDPGN